MLREDVFHPESHALDARERREDLQKRILLAETCCEPLLDQVAAHSPRLAGLLRKVFEGQTHNARKALEAYRAQLAQTRSLSSSMGDLVTYSERQIARSQHKAEVAQRKMAEHKEDLEGTHVSLRILQTEHMQSRKTAFELQALLAEVTEATETDLQWSLENDPKALLTEAVDSLEQERRRKIKSMDTMDRIVDAFEADHLNAMENHTLKVKVPTADAGCTTETDALEQRDAMLALCRARGKVVVAEDALDPPLVMPKRWRVGWHIPFGLRTLMTNFQLNRRALPKGALLRLILSIYQYRVRGGAEPGAEAGAATRSGKRLPGLAPASPPGGASPPPAAGGGVGTRTSANESGENMTLFEASYFFLSHTYGLNKLSDWHVSELVNSCQQHAENRRVRLFGFLLGLYPLSGELPKQGRDTSKGGRRRDPLDGLFTDFRVHDSFCAVFLGEMLKALAAHSELVVPASAADALLVTKHVAVQVVNELVGAWKLPRAGEMVQEISQLHEERVKPSVEEGGGGRRRRSSAAATAAAAAAAAADQAAPARGQGDRPTEDPSIKVDLDSLMFAVARRWEAHEAEWRAKLARVFAEHATLQRYVHGLVVRCESFEEDHAAKLRQITTPASKKHGYFGVLDLEGFRKCLKALNISANKRQANKLFQSAGDWLLAARERRSEALWVKATSHRVEDRGRPYYVNQLSNERVWDTRPLFDNELAEITSANAPEEIDLDAFTFICMSSRIMP